MTDTQISRNLLREYIVKMSQEVESAFEKSTDKNSCLDELFEIEVRVNRYHKLIDDTAFKFIALKAPAATDLRMTLSILKMNSELERIGDQSVAIRRYFDQLNDVDPETLNLKSSVQKMLRKVIDAFIYKNQEKAFEVIESDKEVNESYRLLLKELLGKMKTQAINIDEGFSSLWIAKNIERSGDMCTNIAEGIIFLVNGEDVRHDASNSDQMKSENLKNEYFLSKIDKSLINGDNE